VGDLITLIAGDGHGLAAYVARPEGPARAGLVVCQEIFGVNAHMRDVTDAFAGDGYLAIAPALFDRLERDVELGYSDDDTGRGRALRTALAWDDVMLDVGAAAEEVRGGAGVGVIGYCWGGSVAWLAACRLPVQASVSYYGGQVHEFRAETPGCPVQFHFGTKDPNIWTKKPRLARPPARPVRRARRGRPHTSRRG
jgi:carboxymethylenebutenolidase